ncbi:MAG: heparinase II/III family protein [Rickettsiales bacterium]|nr:heparinase II/III family protein [Rickettsiales bacterium]
MTAEIISSKGKNFSRILRKNTRELRFLSNLIKLRLRLWLTPVCPLSLAMYQEYPRDPWKPEKIRGDAFMSGEFCEGMGGTPFEHDFWKCVRDLPLNWQRRMYEFQWLRDLSVVEDKHKASEFARQLVDEWGEQAELHGAIGRQVTTRAERLAYCFSYHDLLARGASLTWLKKQQNYYFKELLMLGDILRRKEHYIGFSGLKALLFASMLFPSMSFLMRPVNRMMHRAMKTRFFEDGGHRTRSPEFQRWDVATLLETRAAMKHRHIPITPEFDAMLQRGLDALAGLAHGDGKVACFHNSIEEPVNLLMSLWQEWRKSKPLPQKILPDMGYVHLKRKDSTFVFDVGYRPMTSIHHYAGALAFEFSRIGARMVVNCGAYRGEDEVWKKVSYRTAAHSTLSLDQYDAWGKGQCEESFKAGHCSVEEGESDIRVMADHYGYADRLGYVHEREVALSEDGKILTGRDSLRPVVKHLVFAREKAQKMHLRFHLHPSVTVEKMAPQAITLKLKNGEFWNFTVDDADVVPLVEESIYLGENGLPQTSFQLVISAILADAEEEKSFSWKFEWNKS